MLTEDELIELCDAHELTPEAILIVRGIRESLPSRNVQCGTRNVVTHYASRKMRRVIKAEAMRTELAALYEWDHDKLTYEFYDQPPKIKKIYVRADGRRTVALYTPDFFVLSKDFIGWVECKAEGWLQEQAQKAKSDFVRDEQGVWRCPPAERYAQEVGLQFAVRSSADSDPIQAKNIADLADYFLEECPPSTDEQLELASHQMREFGWCWLVDLVGSDPVLTADVVHKLIVDEKLFVDLSVASLMNESRNVRVFSSQALFDSRHQWLADLSNDRSETNPISNVAVEPGATVVWDGEPWEVVNVGESQIFMRSGKSPAIKHMPLSEFQLLVAENLVAANELTADPRRATANALLASATSAEVEQAMYRHYCLHPESRPDDRKRYIASDRALRKWRRLERDGLALYGNGFVGLLPAIRKRGNRLRKLDPRTLEVMDEVIKTEVTSPAAKGLANCWVNARTKCIAAGVLPPSQKTFMAEVKRLLAPEEFKKAREGEKAGYDLELPFLSLKRETPKHGTRPFDYAHIDHTEMDLQFVDEETGVNMGKAWLTVMMDPNTREVLAWILLFDPPSYRSCMLVIRRCVKLHGRLPSTIIVDHGSDFISGHFDRLLAFLGVSKRLRPKSKPRFGSVIERFFGLTNEEFIHNLMGNNKALLRPRRMSPSHDPRKLAIWNLRAFSAAFQGYLDTVYHVVEHPALGLSPLKARELGLLHSGARRHTWIVYDRNFVIATLPTTTKGAAKIQKEGSFKAQKIEFFAHELRSYIGQDLEVRYDPFDVSHAFVMGANGWIEGVSMYADQFVGRSAKEIAQLSQEIGANNSRDYARSLAKADALGAFNQQVKATELLLASELQATRDRIQRGAAEGGSVIDVPASDATNVLSFPEKKLQRDQEHNMPQLPSNYKFEILEDF